MLLFGIAPSFAAARVDSYTALRSDSRTGSDGKAPTARAADSRRIAARARRRSRRRRRAARAHRPTARVDRPRLRSGASVAALVHRPGEHVRIAAAHLERREGVARPDRERSRASSPRRRSRASRSRARRLHHEGDAVANSRRRTASRGRSFRGSSSARTTFETFRIPILRGRSFAQSDTRGSGAGRHRQRGARASSSGRTKIAIGKQLRVVYDTSGPRTVIGIAQNTHFRDLRDVEPGDLLRLGAGGSRSGTATSRCARRSRSRRCCPRSGARRATSNPRSSIWDIEDDGRVARSPAHAAAIERAAAHGL